MGVSLHYLAPFFLLIEGVTYNYIHTTLSPRQHLRLQHGWFKVRSLKWGGSPSHESWTSVLTKICVTVSINTVQLWSPNFLSTLIFPCYRWPVPLGITVLTMANTEQIYLGLQKQAVSVGHTLGPNTRFNLPPSFLDLVVKTWVAISFRCALCFLGHHSGTYYYSLRVHWAICSCLL